MARTDVHFQPVFNTMVFGIMIHSESFNEPEDVQGTDHAHERATTTGEHAEWPGDTAAHLLTPTVATETHQAPFLSRLAAQLTAAATANEACSGAGAPQTEATAVFFASRAPAIPLEAYVHRLARFSGCSAVAFVYASCYIMDASATVPISPVTAHRCGDPPFCWDVPS